MKLPGFSISEKSLFPLTWSRGRVYCAEEAFAFAQLVNPAREKFAGVIGRATDRRIRTAGNPRFSF